MECIDVLLASCRASLWKVVGKSACSPVLEKIVLKQRAASHFDLERRRDACRRCLKINPAPSPPRVCSISIILLCRFKAQLKSESGAGSQWSDSHVWGNKRCCICLWRARTSCRQGVTHFEGRCVQRVVSSLMQSVRGVSTLSRSRRLWHR